MKKTQKSLQFIAFFAAVLLILCSFLAGCKKVPAPEPQTEATETKATETEAEAVTPESAFTAIGDAYVKRGAPGVGTLRGEWIVLGLVKAGRFSADFEKAYMDAVRAAVKEAGSSRLSETRATENARVALGVSAAGHNAHDVDGVDLYGPLLDRAFVAGQGINGTIWALMALEKAMIKAPDTDAAIAEYTASLLAEACPDGGYAFMGEQGDVDLTAMAIQALVPQKKDAEVAAAIDRAVAFLANAQAPDGTFPSFGVVSSESISQVILALSEAGIDLDHDTRFIKDGKTPADVLLLFYTDGGFRHTLTDSAPDERATEQAYLALASLFEARKDRP